MRKLLTTTQAAKIINCGITDRKWTANDVVALCRAKNGAGSVMPHKKVGDRFRPFSDAVERLATDPSVMKKALEALPKRTGINAASKFAPPVGFATTKQVAEATGLTQNAARNECEAGRFPGAYKQKVDPIRLGHFTIDFFWVVPWASVDTYLSETD